MPRQYAATIPAATMPRAYHPRLYAAAAYIKCIAKYTYIHNRNRKPRAIPAAYDPRIYARFCQ